MSNYIEEKLKEFNNWYDDLDDGLYQADKSEIIDFIKQALQEQEERIREEEYQRRKKEKCETAEVNYKTGYNKGVRDALNGRIESFRTLTIKETIDICQELQKYFKNIGRMEAKQEMKEKLMQIVIEDMPHKYQERLLKELNI